MYYQIVDSRNHTRYTGSFLTDLSIWSVIETSFCCRATVMRARSSFVATTTPTLAPKSSHNVSTFGSVSYRYLFPYWSDLRYEIQTNFVKSPLRYVSFCRLSGFDSSCSRRRL